MACGPADGRDRRDGPERRRRDARPSPTGGGRSATSMPTSARLAATDPAAALDHWRDDPRAALPRASPVAGPRRGSGGLPGAPLRPRPGAPVRGRSSRELDAPPADAGRATTTARSAASSLGGLRPASRSTCPVSAGGVDGLPPVRRGDDPVRRRARGGSRSTGWRATPAGCSCRSATRRTARDVRRRAATCSTRRRAPTSAATGAGHACPRLQLRVPAVVRVRPEVGLSARAAVEPAGPRPSAPASGSADRVCRIRSRTAGTSGPPATGTVGVARLPLAARTMARGAAHVRAAPATRPTG